jgi:hypothetical protein
MDTQTRRPKAIGAGIGWLGHQAGLSSAAAVIGRRMAREKTERKQFFIEKKNAETFARPSPTTPRQPRKSFCFFFQKEVLFLSLFL